jgi:hypothetical protein
MRRQHLRPSRSVGLAICAMLVCSGLAPDIGGQGDPLQDRPAGSFGSTPADATRTPAIHQNPLLGPRLEQMYAASDFNGDGLQDLAVVDFLTDTVRIMVSEPDGAFRAANTIATRRGPRAIAAADFDVDGFTDLAVGEFLSGTVHVFAGHGDGTFTSAQTVRVGEGVNSLLADDLDGDLRVDIVVANPLSGTVVLLKNAGNGSFDGPIEAARADAFAVLLVDVDDDGTQDLATLDAKGEEVRVFAGLGGGQFAEARAEDADRVVLALKTRSIRARSAATAYRLEKISGDGLAHPVAADASETLVVEVADAAVAAAAAEPHRVVFSDLTGKPDSAGSGPAAQLLPHIRTTNERGQASLAVAVPALPEVSVVAAALPSDQVTHFGVLSVMTQKELEAAVEAAVALERSDDIERAERVAFVRRASDRLEKNDSAGAVRALRSLLNQLPSEQEGNRGPASVGGAADMSRRFINQVLLVGVVPTVVDDEALGCDVPLTRTIAANAEVDRFTFACQGGEVVHITLGNQGGSAGSFDPVWRLTNSDGSPASVCGTLAGAGGRDCTVPAAGGYAVEVKDNGANGTGTYSVHLQRLTASERCTASTLTCDATLTTTIEAFADTDLHEFTGTIGEVVHITLSNDGGTSGSFFPVWRLIAPDGTAAAVCGTPSGAGGRDCSLSVSGDYGVEVSDNDVNGAGAYGLHLQRLTAAQRCSAATLACDSPVAGTITAFSDTALHNFSGVAGEVVHITLSNNGGTSGSFFPVWRLIAASGSAATVCGTLSGAGGRDCTLPAAGAYAVEVSDNDVNGAGAYTLHLQRLTAAQRCATSTLTCDTPATGTISAFADTALHNFTGTAGEVVHITLSNNGGTSGSFFPVWRLIAASGSAAAVCGTLSGAGGRDCTLPAAGAYAVEVSDNDVNGAGAYTLHLQRLTASTRCGGSISCGVPLTTTISSFADTDLHTFSGVPGDAHITLTNNGGTSGSFFPIWRLIAPDGTPASACGTFVGAGEFDCALPSAGGYAVEVSDNDVNGTGTYTLTVSGAGCVDVPTVTVSAVDATAIEAGLDAGAFRFTRTGNTASALTVNYTIGGTATAGADYSALSGSATIPATASFVDIAVTPLSDTIKEANETVVLTIAAGSYDVGSPGAATVTITQGPDLIVSSLLAPLGANPGQTINVTVATRNQGTLASTATTTTRLWLSADNKLGSDTLLTTVTVPGLGAGVTNTQVVPVTIAAGTSLSKRFLIAQADATTVQAEANEANNLKPRSIAIGPDYVVSALSISPTSVPAGATFSINDTTKNNGGPVATNTVTQFYLSTDKVLGGGDALLTQRTVPPLSAGQVSAGTTTATMPAGTPSGPRFIIAVGDGTNATAELNESNNKRVVAVTIP